MAQKDENFNCLWGNPVFVNGQWTCDTSGTVQNPTPTVYPFQRKQEVIYIPQPVNIQSDVEKALKNILGTSNVNTGENPVADFVSNNKWLVLGGLAFLAYSFLGGKPKTREVTSISKY